MKKIAFLLVLPLFLASCGSITKFIATPTPTATATSTATATTTATATRPPPTVTPVRTGTAPVLKGVNVRYDRSAGEIIALEDVWFSDPDGDVVSIHTFIVAATTRNLTVQDVTINIPAQIQIPGVTIVLNWRCGIEKYDLTLRMVLFDKQGNQSNGLEYTIHCRDNA